MGWDFAAGATKQEIVKELTDPRTYNAGTTILKSALKLNRLYVLVERNNERTILVCLLKEDKDYGWGYKLMDECEEPYYYDCPLSLIDLAGPTQHEGANRWRAKVIALHGAKQRAKSAVVIGDVVTFEEGTNPPAVRIISTKPMRGTANGRIYSIPARLLASGTITRQPA